MGEKEYCKHGTPLYGDLWCDICEVQSMSLKQRKSVLFHIEKYEKEAREDERAKIKKEFGKFLTLVPIEKYDKKEFVNFTYLTSFYLDKELKQKEVEA